MSDQTAISSMPLYTHLDRVEKALAALGVGRRDPIRPEQLFAIDQWHYHGTYAIRAAAEALRLGPASRVLDVGSGIGGPARYLAHTTGCHVTALELQPELHQIGVDLTRRSGLAGRVTHLCGDALTYPLPLAEFDAAVSWLAILHISDRRHLFARLARALRAGGHMLCRGSLPARALRSAGFGRSARHRPRHHGDQPSGLCGRSACSGLRGGRHDGPHERLGAVCRRAPPHLAAEPRGLYQRSW